MEITFNLPHVFNVASSRLDNAYALKALLDCMIELNLGFLKVHSVPALYRSGVVYGRTDIWEPIPALYDRGFGDCKSLATAYIAELRRQGLPATPVFRFHERNDGNLDFHILVETVEKVAGRERPVFKDPSKVLGMGADEVAKFYGPAARSVSW